MTNSKTIEELIRDITGGAIPDIMQHISSMPDYVGDDVEDALAEIEEKLESITKLENTIEFKLVDENAPMYEPVIIIRGDGGGVLIGKIKPEDIGHPEYAYKYYARIPNALFNGNIALSDGLNYKLSELEK